MNVLVAGASGFIGRNFLLRSPRDWNITGIYHQSPSFTDFLQKVELANVTAVQCDLRDSDRTRQCLCDQSFDVCLFVLGNSDIGLSLREPLTDLNSNLLTLINLCSNIKVKKFIFMSSGTVYLGQTGAVNISTPTNPSVPYGISKLMSENYIKIFQSQTEHIEEYVILRFFGAYGPLELPRKIYTSLIRTFALDDKNEYSISGDGENLIDAMYIDDTIDGILKIIESTHKNVVVDFCKGDPISIFNLVKQTASILGKEKVDIKRQGQTSEPITFIACPKRMNEIFDFRAQIPLSEGITKFADYLKKSNGN